MKPCAKCGSHEKLARGRCAPCTRAAAAKYYAAHPAAASVSNKKYYAANKEKKLAEHKIYRGKNRASLLQAQRERRGLPAPTRPEPAACEICAKPYKHALCVEHNHATGAFRGWVCRPCNLMLGYARDNPAILRAGAAFLTWS